MAATPTIEPAKQYKAVINGQECLVETVHCVDDGFNWLCCRTEGSNTAITIPASELRPVAQTTILLVEPDPVQRQLVTILLNSGGFRVLAASRAEEAIDIARSEVTAIDVLLTSVRIPGTDGPSLSANISVLHPVARTIYTSSNTYDELAREYRQSIPYDSFIPKPLYAESLADMLRGTL